MFCTLDMLFFFFFFFQAEDGIRDGHVTGVQTCALPISIKHERFKEDFSPLDLQCRCPVCRRHSRAYLRNLFVLKDFSAPMLLSIHNVFFYLDWMRTIRGAIEIGRASCRERGYSAGVGVA